MNFVKQSTSGFPHHHPKALWVAAIHRSSAINSEFQGLIDENPFEDLTTQIDGWFSFWQMSVPFGYYESVVETRPW